MTLLKQSRIMPDYTTHMIPSRATPIVAAKSPVRVAALGFGVGIGMTSGSSSISGGAVTPWMHRWMNAFCARQHQAPLDLRQFVPRGRCWLTISSSLHIRSAFVGSSWQRSNSFKGWGVAADTL